MCFQRKCEGRKDLRHHRHSHRCQYHNSCHHGNSITSSASSLASSASSSRHPLFYGHVGSSSVSVAVFDYSLSLSMRASERSRSPLRLDVDVHTDNDDFDDVAAVPSELATVWAELHEWQPNVFCLPIRLGPHCCLRPFPPLHHAA